MRTATGGWSAPRILPPLINSKASESSPSFSPDGKWLYFTSERGLPTRPRTGALTHRELVDAMHSVLNGLGNIYEVDLKAALP